MSQPTPPPANDPHDRTDPNAGQGYGQPQQPYGQPTGQPYGQAPQYPSAGQYSYGQQGYQGGPGHRPGVTNNMAVIALIAGIAGLTIVPFIGSIVAVITGPMAKRQIAERGEEGSGMATAGIITGWIGIALSIIGVIVVIFAWGALVAAMDISVSST